MSGGRKCDPRSTEEKKRIELSQLSTVADRFRLKLGATAMKRDAGKLVGDHEFSTNLGSDLDGDWFSQSDRVKFDFGGDPPLDQPLLSLDTHHRQPMSSDQV